MDKNWKILKNDKISSINMVKLESNFVDSVLCDSFESVFEELQKVPELIKNIVYTKSLTDLHFYLLHVKQMNGFPCMDGATNSCGCLS